MDSEIDVSRYKKGWFVCAVTRNHELKVYRELRKLLEHEHWGNYIYDMFLPMQKTRGKNGEEKLGIVPGYEGCIYIEMQLTPETYNVLSIDGFRMPLPAKDPVPIPSNQMVNVFKHRIDDF